jgi:hypothetical protein
MSASKRRSNCCWSPASSSCWSGWGSAFHQGSNASSTPGSAIAARSLSASAHRWKTCSRSSAGAPTGTRPAKAPSGTDAAARVARTHSVAAPSARAPASASLASRVLPTPAAPLITTPQHRRSRRTAATHSSSSSRPMNGHDTCGTRELGGLLVMRPVSCSTRGAPGPSPTSTRSFSPCVPPGHPLDLSPRHSRPSRTRNRALAITDEASPFAQRSTRNRPRRAGRRLPPAAAAGSGYCR